MIALVVIHRFNVGLDLLWTRVYEDAAFNLRGQCLKCSCLLRGASKISLVREDVDCRSNPLAHIDCIFQARVAHVVYAVCEKQDKIAGHLYLVRIPPHAGVRNWRQRRDFQRRARRAFASARKSR